MLINPEARVIITSNASPGERGWGRRGGQGRGEDKESLPCPGDGGEDREDKESRPSSWKRTRVG